MQPTWVDHVFVLALIAYFPLYGRKGTRLLKREIDDGVDDARIRSYRRGMLDLWIMAILVLGYWAILNRSWTELGLGLPHGRSLWIGLSVVAVALVVLVGQFLYLVRRADPASLPAGVREVGYMMPHTTRDSRWFSGLSVTAGVCEEIIYRGYLLAYFGTWFDWPLALLFSSLVFGLGHAYQGPAGVLKTALVGATFGWLVLSTGSVWASMVLHAAVDWTAGIITYRIYGSTTTGVAKPAVEARP